MLEENLKQLAKSHVYPFHMPGHKRQAAADFGNPYAVDITEIEGFDNLHHACGILKDEQERAAALYGSKQCRYLVNGSTCGILAAISAATRPGDRILMARGCHRSVYHAVYLRRLRPVYVYQSAAAWGMPGQIRPEEIRQKLADYPDIRAVIITSPTYEGIVSDVEAIARAAHERDIPLIVDEAHGAHFGFHEAFPENATRLGADAVVMSVHKTLPALTQTALLHLCSGRISAEETDRFLGIYESSSPSYVLMAGIARCINLLSDASVRERFADYARLLIKFREEAGALKHIRVPGAADFKPEEAFAFDPGKLILSVADTAMTGSECKARLLGQYGLQTEMAGETYVLAMTSFMDSREGFARLLAALKELDAVCSEGGGRRIPYLYREQSADMEIWRAADAESETVPIAEAAGRICKDYICLYPPGIPVLVPGERMRRETLADIMECAGCGLDVEGLAGTDAIRVVKSD